MASKDKNNASKSIQDEEMKSNPMHLSEHMSPTFNSSNGEVQQLEFSSKLIQDSENLSKSTENREIMDIMDGHQLVDSISASNVRI